MTVLGALLTDADPEDFAAFAEQLRPYLNAAATTALLDAEAAARLLGIHPRTRAAPQRLSGDGSREHIEYPGTHQPCWRRSGRACVLGLVAQAAPHSWSPGRWASPCPPVSPGVADSGPALKVAQAASLNSERP
jgi:hypothetical protein